MTPHETAFEMAVSSIRFGDGVTREVGMDLAELGARNVLVITDPALARLAPGRDRARIARGQPRPLHRLRPRARRTHR